jgi:hypothetical protein
MQAIVEDKTIKHFFIVGTLRNNNLVGPIHIAFEWTKDLSANSLPIYH